MKRLVESKWIICKDPNLQPLHRVPLRSQKLPHKVELGALKQLTKMINKDFSKMTQSTRRSWQWWWKCCCAWGGVRQSIMAWFEITETILMGLMMMINTLVMMMKSRQEGSNWFLSDPCVTTRGFADLTDVTLADEDTNSIFADNYNRAIQGNVAMQVAPPDVQMLT